MKFVVVFLWLEFASVHTVTCVKHFVIAWLCFRMINVKHFWLFNKKNTKFSVFLVTFFILFWPFKCNIIILDSRWFWNSAKAVSRILNDIVTLVYRTPNSTISIYLVTVVHFILVMLKGYSCSQHTFDGCGWCIRPTSGGKHITKDNTQTPATNNLARFVDIILG